jgi:hypothetical protein
MVLADHFFCLGQEWKSAAEIYKDKFPVSVELH